MAESKPPKKRAARKKAAKPKSKAKPRAGKKQAPKPSDETQEYALGDDFLADLNEEEAKAEEPQAEEPHPEPPMDTEEAELQEIINAETQEWDGIDPEDPEMLQDLIVAAIGEASRKVEETMQEKMGSLAGGLGIPGL